MSVKNRILWNLLAIIPLILSYYAINADQWFLAGFLVGLYGAVKHHEGLHDD